MRRNRPVDDAQHLSHHLGSAGKKEAEWIGETQDPLTDWLLWKDLVRKKCCRFHHAPGAAARAETSSLARKCDQALRVATVTAHPQESMLKPPTAQKLIKFPTLIVRQCPAFTGHPLSKRRVVFLHEHVEQRLLGPVALVTVRILFRLRRTC